MSASIQAIRGMHDVLPEESPRWQWVERVFREVSERFGYEEIRPPLVEAAQLYVRSIGESTDIVGKEMYVFTDRAGEELALRPELTAGVVRAVVQHGLLARRSLWRLWYYGAAFRYERPQKGRYRQFHQYGVECIGSPYPESDAEVILLAVAVLRELGIADYRLQLNTLGSPAVRQRYRTALVAYLESVREKLSPESQLRLERNPLRILDSKDERDQALLRSAPLLIEYLDAESREHFEALCRMLQQQGVPFELNPHLVRGLDYYTHTVFEFVSSRLGAQNAFGGGGRYDGLVESFGGPPTPAVGFSFGVERLLLLLPERTPDGAVEIYVARAEVEPEIALSLLEELRRAGYRAVGDLQRRSLKAQLREADRLGARLAIILGRTEWQQRRLVLRDLRNGQQWECPVQELGEHVRRILQR
ncbi:MAG: histidine--tRNA ligase [Chlorobiota bacterium]|nr:histidine--tRNA ligase [Chlorobiota bacterium]